MKTKYIITVIVIVLLAIGGYVYKSRSGKSDVHYTTIAAEKGIIQESVSASGTLNPVKVVNVGTQVSGVVNTLHADYNDHVEKGQLLAELDPSLLNTQRAQSGAALTSATTAFNVAQANYTRMAELYKLDYVAKADLQQAEQTLAAARAERDSAKAQVQRDDVNLGYAIIRSPVSGVVISRSVDIGQTVAASFQTPTLFSIAEDLRKMQIDTNLSEADVGDVHEGQAVNFTVDAFPDRHFDGKVRQVRLNPTTVQNVVTYDVVVDVENTDLTLLPGMTAFTIIIEAAKPDVLKVPNAGLSFSLNHKKDTAAAANVKVDPSTKTVYVLKDNHPQPVKIKIGLNDAKTTEVTEVIEGALQPGDLIITGQTGTQKESAGKSGFGGPGGIRF